MTSPRILTLLSLLAFLPSCEPTPATPVANSESSGTHKGGSSSTSKSSTNAGGSSAKDSSSTNSSQGGSSDTSSMAAGGSSERSSSTAKTSVGGSSSSSQSSSSSGGASSKVSASASSIASTSKGGASNASTNATPIGGVSAAAGSSNPGSTVPGAGSGGAAGAAPIAGASGAHVDYELPPPDQCHDQDVVPYDYQTKSGCKDGDAAGSTMCGGKCNVINACAEDTAQKPHADIAFMCQRNLLFSPEMEQAAADDGNYGFRYAVAGHDADRNGIDGTDTSSCCQCYQLVYAYPSVANDRQGQLNPDNPNPPASAVQIPIPLIVQVFNTAATPQTFDIYMPAGGLGANNACAQVAGSTSKSGKYMYTAYPADGQPSQGGFKPASLFSECRTKEKNWLTDESMKTPECKKKIEDGCNKITSTIPGLTEQSRQGCILANSVENVPPSFYHLNWSVYAMKVECPEHLTRVTGCKLAPQGLPKVKADITTAAKAALDSQFWTKTGSTNNLYETTTMEDCCRPSCAAINWISGRGLKPDAQYRAFYSCNEKGVPWTQPE